MIDHLPDYLVPINSDMGINGIIFMSNSRYVITSGGDSSVRLWDIWGNGEIIRNYPSSSAVTSLALDEDSLTLAAGCTGSEGIVHVWSPVRHDTYER